MTAVVSDASCLIALDRAGHLHSLPRLFGAMAVPEEVAAEYGRSQPWLIVHAVRDQAKLREVRETLDLGEAAALVLAWERGWQVIVDERKARAVARRIGVVFTGTLGVVKAAKQRGLIAAIRPVLDDLRAVGFFLNSRLIEQALRDAGEL